MQVQLIAVPYDSGRRGERMGAGPERLLGAGLVARLADAGHAARVQTIEPPAGAWHSEIRTTFDLAAGVSRAVTDAIDAGRFPLVLSGNCGPAALGCVAGMKGAASVFWFDAHGDFNTPDTTVGGFLDGMAMATLTGRCWPALVAAIPGSTPVAEKSVVLVGARDLDPLEALALEASAVRRVPPADLRTGLPRAIEDLRTTVPAPVYLHLDLDVMDPSEGRSNCYAAPGGLSREDVEWAIATIADAVPLGAAALTALDPAADPDGRTVEAALTLGVAIVSGAGKSNDRR
jgi:arginase